MPDNKYWVVLTLSRWNQSKLSSPPGLQLATKMADGSIGYLPVYEAKEDAETAAKRYPGARVVGIRKVQEETDDR